MTKVTLPTHATEALNFGLAHQDPKRGRWLDVNRQFDPKPLNTWLRKQAKAGNPAVTGDYRHGYCIEVEGVRLGVTNGYGPGFVVFVTPVKK